MFEKHEKTIKLPDMEFMFTSPETQIDKGFGVLGQTYITAANLLSGFNAPQYKEMPICFLYRHGLELILKSLIITFYEKFEPTSEKILVGTKPLEQCHHIDELYKTWINLEKKHKKNLENKFPDGDWNEHHDISENINLIVQYDKESDYFRYPISKKSKKDNEKNSRKEIPPEELLRYLNEKKGQGIVSVISTDSQGVVKSAFVENENILNQVLTALQKTSESFKGILIMTRCLICNGK